MITILKRFTLFAFLIFFTQFSHAVCGGSVPSDLNYKDALARCESGGNYQAVNSLGYMGKYQFGGSALVDAGCKDRSGAWTGKCGGATSKEAFLNCPECQETALDKYNFQQEKYMDNLGLNKYVGQTINGEVITKSGMMAGAHLVGIGSLQKYLNSGGKIVPKDGNNVPISTYISNMGGRDINSSPTMAALSNTVDKVGGAISGAASRLGTALGITQNVGLGKDVGGSSNYCEGGNTFVGISCYVKDACNLSCKQPDAAVASPTTEMHIDP